MEVGKKEIGVIRIIKVKNQKKIVWWVNVVVNISNIKSGIITSQSIA